MKHSITFQAVSDLHLEFDRQGALYQLPINPEAEFILMAGDIASKGELTEERWYEQLEWIKKVGESIPVFLILGNHELYGQTRESVIRTYREFFKGSGVTFLQNESVLYKGFRIIGTDLWTNFELQGPGTSSAAQHAANEKMSDFRQIKFEDDEGLRRLRPEDTVRWHDEACDYIKRMLNECQEPVILLTHHGISAKCQHKGYPKSDLLAAAFCSNLEQMLDECEQAPVLAVFGHTHDNTIDRLACGTVVYSNQRGYKGFERPANFIPDRLITITAQGDVVIEGCEDI